MRLFRYRALAAAFAVLACLRTAGAQVPPVYYVHSGLAGSDPGGITGPDTQVLIASSDANPGTDPGHPLRTLGPAGLQSKTPPFVAYIAGRFYTDDATPFAFLKEEACGVEMRQWPGQAQAQIKMSNKLGQGWDDLGSGVFAKICNASPDLRGADVSAFCIDYEWAGHIDPQGRHRSFLPILATPALAAAAAGTPQGGIYLDTITGGIVLGLPAGEASPNAPHANGVEYVIAGRSGIGLLSNEVLPINTGIVVQGLRIGPCCGAGVAPLGCGIAVLNSNGFQISDNVITDHGVHAISIGLACTDDTTRNNTAIGMADGGISFVWDCFGPGQQATNCRSFGDRSYINTLLGCDGRSLARGFSIGGFYVHGHVHDVEYVNCQTFEYGGNESMDHAAPAAFAQEDHLDGSTPLITPSDINDPETYPIRWRRTDPSGYGFNGSTCFPNQGLLGYAAFINERFDGSNFGRLGSANYIDRRSMTGRWAFVGCEMVLSMSAALDMAAFALGPQSQLTLVNSSIYDAAPAHSANRFALINYAGAGEVTAVGDIWGFRSADTGTFMLSFGDSTIGPEKHLFTACEFWNLGGSTYTQNAAFDTREEWAAHIDIGAVSPGDNPFSDAAGLTGLGLSPAETSRRSHRNPHTAAGANGAPYSGNYGAYQYPGGDCQALVTVLPVSSSLCSQESATLTASPGAEPITSIQWIWRPTPNSPWASMSDGPNPGPDGRSWFHASGTATQACTITYAAEDLASSIHCEIACIGSTACTVVASDPVALQLVNPPTVVSISPPGLTACQSQEVVLEVQTDAFPPAAITFAWQLQELDGSWSDLPEGPVVRAGRPVAESHDAATAQLRYWLRDPAYGRLRVILRNRCGASTSAPVSVGFSTADFNGDGDVGTDLDIEAFFACLSGSCCPTCRGTDFNGDADVGTDADIEAFFTVLAGGSC